MRRKPCARKGSARIPIIGILTALLRVGQSMAQARQDHQSHNKTSKADKTSKAEKKQMGKYVEEYVPAAYEKKALREEGLSKNSNHRNSDSTSEGGAVHGSGSSIELLEQAQQDHQLNNKTSKADKTSKAEKKQMRRYVEEYVPAAYEKKALREEGLSKNSNHRNSDSTSEG